MHDDAHKEQVTVYLDGYWYHCPVWWRNLVNAAKAEPYAEFDDDVYYMALSKLLAPYQGVYVCKPKLTTLAEFTSDQPQVRFPNQAAYTAFVLAWS